MLKRIAVAVVCIPLILVLIYALPPLSLPIALSFVCMIGVHEVLWSTGFVKNIRISCCSILLAGAIPFWVYVGEKPFPFLVGLLLFVVLIFLEALHSRGTVTVEKIGGSLFFAVLIPYFLSSFIRLHAMELGGYWIILPLLVAFASDAAALFAGLLFGRHKLAPSVSPKKTVEGAVGGLLGAVAGILLYGLFMQHGARLEVHYGVLALYGVLGSLISQLGDLSFSYIKRQYHIKDFGNILPGHGGILDRFDSVIFCAPLIEVLVLLAPAFAR